LGTWAAFGEFAAGIWAKAVGMAKTTVAKIEKCFESLEIIDSSCFLLPRSLHGRIARQYISKARRMTVVSRNSKRIRQVAVTFSNTVKLVYDLQLAMSFFLLIETCQNFLNPIWNLHQRNSSLRQ
jgi:hypothetical protein